MSSLVQTLQKAPYLLGFRVLQNRIVTYSYIGSGQIQPMEIFQTNSMNENDIVFRDIACLSNPNGKYKYFKLTVAVTQYDQLFNDNLWPRGVRVIPYITKNISHHDGKSIDTAHFYPQHQWDSPLCMCTYNVHGFNDTKVSLKSIFSSVLTNMTVLLQKHWLLDSECHVFNDKLSAVVAHCISGMDETSLKAGIKVMVGVRSCGKHPRCALLSQLS